MPACERNKERNELSSRDRVRKERKAISKEGKRTTCIEYQNARKGNKMISTDVQRNKEGGAAFLILNFTDKIKISFESMHVVIGGCV